MVISDRYLLAILASVCFLLPLKVCDASPPAGIAWEYVPELSDEFSVQHVNSANDGINRSKWWDFHPTWTGRLPSQFNADNTRVEDGKLKISATSRLEAFSPDFDPTTQHWMDTGVVTTRAEAWPGYYFEASIKVADVSAPSSWWLRQGSKSEIDILENVGRPTNPDQAFRETKMSYNTHFFDPGPNVIVGSEGPDSSTVGQLVDDNGDPLFVRDHFITYGMWWESPTSIRFFYNGNELAQVQPGGSIDEGLNMIFDMEVFNFAGLPTIASLQDSTRNTMQVDWVRVYRPQSAAAPLANLVDNPGFEVSHPNQAARPDLWSDCGKYDGCGADTPFETRTNQLAKSGDWSLRIDNQLPNSFTQFKEIGTRDNVYSVLPGQTVHQEVWLNLQQAWDNGEPSDEKFVFAVRLNGDPAQPRTGAGRVVDANGNVLTTFDDPVEFGRELSINDLFGGSQLNQWVKLEYDYVVPELDALGNPVEFVTTISYIDNKTSTTPVGGVMFVDDFSFSIADAPVAGDLDGDGDVDHADIDALATAVRLNATSDRFDLNNDGVVNFSFNATPESDSDHLIRTILGTEYGDANLDGEVNIIDLDLLGQTFGNESGWRFGDFNGSGNADLIDLDLLGQTYGFTAPSALEVVPEPRTMWQLAIGLVILLPMATIASRRRLAVLVAAGVLFLLTSPTAQATLVVTDAMNRATVTVTSAPSAATGFTTYTFSVAPVLGSQEVTAIEAVFQAAEIRQVNPNDELTVFTDFNGFIPAGEDVSGDSQFLFDRDDDLALVASGLGAPFEDSTTLRASFTLQDSAAIQTAQPFAQVVLPDAEAGIFTATIAVRDIGVVQEGLPAVFTSVSFGAVAIPEPTAALCGLLVTNVGLLRRRHAG